MDVAARRAFWDQMRTVAATGRTILFATHHLEEAEREAARVIVMDRGRVVADGSGTEIAAVVSGRVLTLRGVSAERIAARSEEHTSELQSRGHLVCRLLLEKKKNSV